MVTESCSSHEQLRCSKNGTAPTFITSKSPLIRKPDQTQFGSCHGCITLGREADCDLQVGVRSCIGALAGKLVFGPQGQYGNLAEALTAIEVEVLEEEGQFDKSEEHGITEQEEQDLFERYWRLEEAEQALELNLSNVSGDKEAKEHEKRTSPKRRVDAPPTDEGTEERPRKKVKHHDGLSAETEEEVNRIVDLLLRKKSRRTVAELQSELEAESVSRD